MALFDFLRGLTAHITASGPNKPTQPAPPTTSKWWHSWTATKHTKLAHSERLQGQWGKVGRSVYSETGDLGTAARAANGVVHRTVAKDLSRPIVRHASQKSAFLRQKGCTNGKAPGGYEVDHKEALCLGGKDLFSNMQELSKADHAAKTQQDMQTLRFLKERTGVTSREE